MHTILIVEDEARIRRIYRRFLEPRGFRVLEAGNVVDAREQMKLDRIDLVLLDINIGEPNGDTLYEVLSCFHSMIPVIVASVYPVDDQRRLLEAATDYFDKSEGIDVLLHKIDRALYQTQYKPHKQEVKS